MLLRAAENLRAVIGAVGSPALWQQDVGTLAVGVLVSTCFSQPAEVGEGSRHIVESGHADAAHFSHLTANLRMSGEYDNRARVGLGASQE